MQYEGTSERHVMMLLFQRDSSKANAIQNTIQWHKINEDDIMMQSFKYE